MNLLKSAFVVLTLAVASLGAKTWTSVDGRTIDGELISKTENAATIKRTDGVVVTVPLEKLSVADREFVLTAAVEAQKTVDAAKLKALQNSLPQLRALSPLESNWPSCVQVYDRYKRAVAHIRPETLEQNLKNIRADIERDVRTFTPLAQTNLKSPPTQYKDGSWSKGSGAWGDVWAAKSNIAWLNGPLSKHLDKIEALAK